jgi:hypothetical protein
MAAWQCTYCKQFATIQNTDYTEFTQLIGPKSAYGKLCVTGHVLVCPNSDCGEYEVVFCLRKALRPNGEWTLTDTLMSQRLRPSSRAKPYPDYIPVALRSDYNEACAIEELSAKASATLSRRCLQGLIRDFYGITKRTLNDEIAAIEPLVSADLWKAIDGLRQVGNIGAHPEKDTNVIVDVEPGEAAALIELIELLFRTTYEVRYRDQQILAGVTQLADAKKALRSVPAQAALPVATPVKKTGT